MTTYEQERYRAEVQEHEARISWSAELMTDRFYRKLPTPPAELFDDVLSQLDAEGIPMPELTDRPAWLAIGKTVDRAMLKRAENITQYA